MADTNRPRRLPFLPTPAHAVLIVDGHRLFGTALRTALRARGVDAHQLPDRDREGLLAAAAEFDPRVLLLDLSLTFSHPADPASTIETAATSDAGIGELVSGLRFRHRVLAISGRDDDVVTAAAVAAGAIGVLPKATSFDELLVTLARAVAGQPVMTEAQRHGWCTRH